MADKEMREMKEAFIVELVRIYEAVGVLNDQKATERLAEAYKKEGYPYIASCLVAKYKALQH